MNLCMSRLIVQFSNHFKFNLIFDECVPYSNTSAIGSTSIKGSRKETETTHRTSNLASIMRAYG